MDDDDSRLRMYKKGEDLRTARSASFTKSDRSPGRKRRNATSLKFTPVEMNPRVARVQLVLCNISDRSLFFTLKCSALNISAAPAGSGHIAAKSQARLFLTWTLPSYASRWTHVTPPKMLLVTKLFDPTNIRKFEKGQCSTRLMCSVDEKTVCNGAHPPTEQLILDALGKADEHSGKQQQTLSDSERPLIEAKDFLNMLTETFSRLSPELKAVVIFLICCLVYSYLQRSNDHGRYYYPPGNGSR